MEKITDRQKYQAYCQFFPQTQTPARYAGQGNVCALCRIRQSGHAKGSVPAAGHLLLQPRQTFAELLQLFNHINHAEGKALLFLKSH